MEEVGLKPCVEKCACVEKKMWLKVTPRKMGVGLKRNDELSKMWG